MHAFTYTQIKYVKRLLIIKCRTWAPSPYVSQSLLWIPKHRNDIWKLMTKQKKKVSFGLAILYESLSKCRLSPEGCSRRPWTPAHPRPGYWTAGLPDTRSCYTAANALQCRTVACALHCRNLRTERPEWSKENPLKLQALNRVCMTTQWE